MISTDIVCMNKINSWYFLEEKIKMPGEQKQKQNKMPNKKY